jgi:hypothetical protein
MVSKIDLQTKRNLLSYFGFYRIEYGINTENKTEDTTEYKPTNINYPKILEQEGKAVGDAWK